MAPKKPKSERRKGKKDGKLGVEKLDRLLALPDLVLYKILSQVPSIDAVRTSVLSKRWRRVWSKIPGLYFSDSDADSGRDFCKNVWKCMRLREEDIIWSTENPIVKFKLELNKSWRWNSVHKWFRLISKAKLQELDISIEPRLKKSYRLPRDFLHNTLLRSVRLSGFDMRGHDFVRLSSLTSLSLERVVLDDKVLQNLLSECEFLEKLRVCFCSGLKLPKISGLRLLKCLEIGHSVDGEKFMVEAPNLEYFTCINLCASVESSFALSNTVKHLVLISSKFDDLWLEDLICSLPFLESLTIQGCNGLQCVKISGPNLRHFTFHGNGDGCSAVAKVDSPNLVHFCYRGKLMPGFSINPKSLSEVDLRLYKIKNYGKDWYDHLVRFLTSLNCHNSLSVNVYSEKVLSFPEDVRIKYESPLPKLKHMKVTTKKVSRPDNSEFNQILKWVSPSLETCSITKRAS